MRSWQALPDEAPSEKMGSFPRSECVFMIKLPSAAKPLKASIAENERGDKTEEPESKKTEKERNSMK